jgi:NAD+ diphosphatase
MMQQPFESAIDLPFNWKSLDGQFELDGPLNDPGGAGVFVLLVGSTLLLTPERVLPQQLPVADGALPLYIGRWKGQPCRAVRLPGGQDYGNSLSAFELQADEPQLPLALLSLGALAQQLLRWEKNSTYCATCGGRCDWNGDGWGRQCGDCQRHHFPHIHPCVIVLVRRGEELLLVRKANWVPGRYSLVAGFVDSGECLEEAVAREVMEETGVRVKNIRYIGSQSWPFPSQIMAGFVAEYAGGEVKIQESELEDGGWFACDNLPKLPARRSIARFLIDHYGRPTDMSAKE